MDHDTLIKILARVDHSMDQRQFAAQLVFDNPSLVSQLLEIGSGNHRRKSAKACWVIEFAARQDLSCIHKEIQQFLDSLPHIQGESSIRPMAKICELLILEHYSRKSLDREYRLNKYQLEQIATVCFDWLIGPHKVAPKAFSMTCLYHLGKSFDWIHPELYMVLEQNYASESAAYKARARHIFDQLRK